MISWNWEPHWLYMAKPPGKKSAFKATRKPVAELGHHFCRPPSHWFIGDTSHSGYWTIVVMSLSVFYSNVYICIHTLHKYVYPEKLNIISFELSMNVRVNISLWISSPFQVLDIHRLQVSTASTAKKSPGLLERIPRGRGRESCLGGILFHSSGLGRWASLSKKPRISMEFHCLVDHPTNRKWVISTVVSVDSSYLSHF